MSFISRAKEVLTTFSINNFGIRSIVYPDTSHDLYRPDIHGPVLSASHTDPYPYSQTVSQESSVKPRKRATRRSPIANV